MKSPRSQTTSGTKMFRGTTLFTAVLRQSLRTLSSPLPITGLPDALTVRFGASAREGDCRIAFVPAHTCRRLSETFRIQLNSVIAFFEIISLYSMFVNYRNYCFPCKNGIFLYYFQENALIFRFQICPFVFRCDIVSIRKRKRSVIDA